MEASKPVRYAVLLVVALGALGMFWFGMERYWAEREAAAYTGSPELVIAAPGPAVTAPAETPKAQPVEQPKPQLVVHVTGAVVKPGVYRFDQGARIADAIEAAGGALPEGMADALNLAAHLADGDKLYVPTVQEAKAQAPASPAAAGATQVPVTSLSGASTGAASKGTAKGGKVNVNTAGLAELQSVTGIGPATAKAIVEHRTKFGPFKSLENLTDVKGIGPATLEKLRPYLTL